MPQVYSFGITPVSCHSWNKNKTGIKIIQFILLQKLIYIFFPSEVAISPNNNEVQIHLLKGNNWVLNDSLTDHTQRVTGIDWCHVTNQIVTCAAVCYAQTILFNNLIYF